MAGLTVTQHPHQLPAAEAGEGQDRGSADVVARDDAPAAGLSFRGRRLGRTQGESPVFDYDGDGDLDILLSAHGTMSWLLMRNKGDGTFFETRVGTFPQRDRHGCVAGDFGSAGSSGRPDGLVDLYCLIGAERGLDTDEHPNELFLQGPDHTFVDVARSWDIEDPHGRARAAVTVDFDRDGLLDLAVANEGPSMLPGPNRLFKNIGGRFAAVADSVIQREGASECVAAADVDRDHWTDLLFCSSRPQAGVLTYKNVLGTFQDVTTTTSYGRLPARAIKIEDINRDGEADLLVVEQKRLNVWLNTLNGFSRIDFSYPLDEGHDVAVGDVNLDGLPDIYLVQGKNELYDDIMLVSDGSGPSYHMVFLPRATEGEGDVATAISNWDGSGRSAFLVTNGRWSLPGPVQLIAFSAADAPVQFGRLHDEEPFLPPGWLLDGFVAGLGDPDPRVFVQLGAIGHRLGFWSALKPRAVELTPKIVARLSHPAANVRIAALAALGGLRAKAQASTITGMLGDGDAMVRRAAGLAIAQLNADGGRTRDSDQTTFSERLVPSSKVEPLATGARVAELIEKLGSPDPTARRVAIDGLRIAGATGQAPLIADHLGDVDAAVRRAAVAALAGLGAKEQSAMIVRRLNDSDAVVRRAAIGALLQFDARQDQAIVARLADRDIDVARAAVVVLATSGATDQAPSIALMLKDPDRNIREVALRALRALKAKGETAAIVARLEDSDAEMRLAALEVLRAFGASGEVSAIATRLRDSEMGVRLAALAALSALQAREQSPTIAELLADSSQAVRRRAVMALGTLGANEHSRAIARMLDDVDPGVRESALQALLRLDPHAVHNVAQEIGRLPPRPETRAAMYILGIRR